MASTTALKQADADTTSRVEAVVGGLEQRADRLLDDFCDLADDVLEGLRSRRARCVSSIPPDERRVLVVEDDLALLKSYERVLCTVVRHVDIAATVEEAVIKLSEQSYDLLIVDYQLANGTAGDLIGQARTSSQRPLVYSILITRCFNPKHVEALARRIGANDWLCKPVDAVMLQDRVNRAFERLNEDDASIPQLRHGR